MDDDEFEPELEPETDDDGRRYAILRDLLDLLGLRDLDVFLDECLRDDFPRLGGGRGASSESESVDIDESEDRMSVESEDEDEGCFLFPCGGWGGGG